MKALPAVQSLLCVVATIALNAHEAHNPDDEQAIRDVILRFHQAHTERDREQVMRCVGPSFFKIHAARSGDPTQWRMNDYLAGTERQDEWFDFFLSVVTRYQSEVDFVQINSNGFSAVAVTVENGETASEDGVSPWRDAVNTYFLARTDEEWKIVSMMTDVGRQPQDLETGPEPSGGVREVRFGQGKELDFSPPVVVEFPPSIEAGYHFPFYVFIPAIPGDQPLRLLVEPNNTGRASDDLAVHRQRARETVRRGPARRLAERLGTPLLVPVFPRPESNWRIYTHALDRDALLVSEGELQRIDLQLAAMISQARETLAEGGLRVESEVFMNGFSASGNFVNRFAALHPQLVRAVASGAVNGLPIFPLESLDGTVLPYPIGVGDLEQLTGSPFDRNAYRNVSQLVYMGYLDRNDTYPHDDAWNDEERVLIKRLFGEQMMPARWDRSQAILAELDLPLQCVTYNGTAHTIRREMFDDLVAFFRANNGADHVAIEPHQYPFAEYREIEQAHVNGLYWRGDERIPQFARDQVAKCGFAIRIEEWIEGQDHTQLGRFSQKAGFEFTLRAEGKEDIHLAAPNACGTFSSGGTIQAFVIRLDPDQLDRIAPGVPYTLHPENRSESYVWIVDPEVALIRP